MEMRMRTSTFLIIAFSLIPLLALGGCKPKEVEQKEAVRIPVVVSKPGTGTVTMNYKSTGTIEAESESQLSFPSGGRLVEIAVDEGDQVSTGQALARVDSLQYQEMVNAATAAHGAALDAVKAQEAAHEVAQNQVDDAQNRFEQVETNYNRFKQLYAEGVATKKEFEDMEAAYKSAKLAVESAEDGLKASALQVEIASGQADASEAQLEQARKSLSDAVLRAPYDGVVAERMMSVGELAGPGAPVYRITGNGARKVVIRVPEEFHGKVKVGDVVKISLEYYPGQTIDAPVSRITPDVSSESRAFTVEVIVPSEYNALPGSFAQIEMGLEKAVDVLTIPMSAVLSFTDGQGVYVNNNGVAEKRIITIGLIEGETVQVVDGLSADDEVVIVGNRFLNEGANIEATQQAPAAQSE